MEYKSKFSKASNHRKTFQSLLAWKKNKKTKKHDVLSESETFLRDKTLTYGAVGGEVGVIGRCLHVSGLVVAGRNPEGFAPSSQAEVYHCPAEKKRENQQDQQQNPAAWLMQCPHWAVGGHGGPWETVPSLGQFKSLWRSYRGRRLAVWHQTRPLCHFRVILCCRIAHSLNLPDIHAAYGSSASWNQWAGMCLCVYCTDAVSTRWYLWKNARMRSCSVGLCVFNQTTSHKEVNDLANFIKQIA